MGLEGGIWSECGKVGIPEENLGRSTHIMRAAWERGSGVLCNTALNRGCRAEVAIGRATPHRNANPAGRSRRQSTYIRSVCICGVKGNIRGQRERRYPSSPAGL